MGLLDPPALTVGDRGRELQQQKRALALRRWWVSLAGRATAPADIATLTDSIFEGHNLTSYLNRIPYLVQQRLRTTFPTSGVTGGLGYFAPYMTTGPVADWPVVNTGGSTNTVGLGSRSRLWTSSGNKSVLTTSGATHIGVRYYRSGTGGATGTFTVQVDAGGTTTVDCKLSTTSDFIEYQVAIPDTGSHTVTVQWASGAVLFDGFMHYNGDTAAGIRMWEGGHGGGDLATFMGSGSLIGYLGNQMTQIQPSLVVIELGANDYTGVTPITASTFATRLATLISTVRSNVTTAPSIVLVCPYEWADDQGSAA
jgi:hypothetical protein